MAHASARARVTGFTSFSMRAKVPPRATVPSEALAKPELAVTGPVGGDRRRGSALSLPGAQIQQASRRSLAAGGVELRGGVNNAPLQRVAPVSRTVEHFW